MEKKSFPIDDLRDGVANLGPNPRHVVDMSKINEAVQAALTGIPEFNPVKGQFSGSPRLGRKRSAREARRFYGDFSNAQGLGGPGVPVVLVDGRYFDGTVTLIASPRAPKRITGTYHRVTV